MKIRAFDGGLSTRIDAHLIKENEAREYTNINSDTAVLTPVKERTIAVESISRYSHYDTIGNTWVSEATPTDWLEYKEVLYKADRINEPTKFVNGIEYNLGIAKPGSAGTVTALSAPEAIQRATLTADFDGAADLPEGEHKYKIVNRSSTTGYVSYSYFRIPVEEVTIKPTTRGGRPYNTAGTTRSGTRYGTFLRGTVTSGENRVTITFDDTNADEVQVYRYFDSAWRAVTTNFQSAATPVVDDTYDISGNSELQESELLTGTVQYAVTFASTITGAESAPALSDEVDVVNGVVELTNLPTSTDSQVDQIKIYRIGGNLTAFTLVATLSEGTTSYTDNTIDTDLSGTIITSTDYDPAPAGLRYLTEAYAMLFGALADKLRFTPIGKPDAWPTNFFLDFPETITGISKTAIGLLVHTYYKTYLITGTGPTAFAQQPLSNDQGCISHDSIKETKDTALWVSTDGVCASDGSDVKVLSRDKLGKQSLSVVNSVLYDQVYQVQLVDGTVLALDFDRGIFKKFNYDTDYLVVAEDVLYGHSGGKLYSLNSNVDFAAMSWTSPDFEASGLTDQKVYSDVEFYSSGNITLTVLINGKSVGSKVVTTEDNHEYKIPKDSRRGNFISFKITGTGTVRELKWDEASANG